MPKWQDFRSAALCKPKTTTDDINVFCFNGQSFRSIEINAERMFAPVDVYRCLGAKDPRASAKYFLASAESVLAVGWPYPGPKPRVIAADGVLALLDSVRGVNKKTAGAFREWFQSVTVATAPAARMADISDRLEPDVQASLRDAFRAVQEVSVRLATALEKRTEFMAALTLERTGQTGTHRPD